MKAIKVTYIVDNENWNDSQFEDQPERTLLIPFSKIAGLIDEELEHEEFLHEICNIEIVY